MCIGTKQTDCAGKLVKGPLAKWSAARQATVQVVIVSQDGHFSQINRTLFKLKQEFKESHFIMLVPEWNDFAILAIIIVICCMFLLAK